MFFKLFSQFLPALVESSEASYSDLGFKQADKKRGFLEDQQRADAFTRLLTLLGTVWTIFH